jgi:hypothetical protein
MVFWGGCSDGDCMGRVLMGLETCGSGRVGSTGCVGWVRGGDDLYHSRLTRPPSASTSKAESRRRRRHQQPSPLLLVGVLPIRDVESR